MKNILLLSLLLSSAAVVGCHYDHLDNTADSIKWIKTHPKPISVNKLCSYENGDNRYTLIDSAGDIYDTRGISLELPPIEIKKP